MHRNLPRLPEYGGRGVEVARLVPVGHENVVPEHAVRPHETPAARTPGPGETPDIDASRTTSRPVRVGPAARHARSSDARPPAPDISLYPFGQTPSLGRRPDWSGPWRACRLRHER